MLALLVMATSQAKDIREIWLSMPDSLILYLDKSMRIEMVDYIDMQVKADVKNTLQGSSVMDTLTHDFLQVTLNEACTLQMRTLPTEDGDTVFCLVRTFRGPQAESEVCIYRQDWQKTRQLTFTPEAFIVKPDTMTTATFDDLKHMMDVILVGASLSVDAPTLTVSASAVNLTKGEADKIRPILPSRILLWNGKEFQ